MYEDSSVLCWYCENCVPNQEGTRGCSWSRFLKPVEGWTVKQVRHKMPNGTIEEVVRVVDCPEFIDAGYENLSVPIGEQRRKKK